MRKEELLGKLPPPTWEKKLIRKRQDIPDIVDEVLNAHQVFAPDYDRIAGTFAGGSTEKRLYDFCRQNLRYEVEDENTQTTRSPAALLTMGHCDCKGYAGFIAGVLDGLNRQGKGDYDWTYRFANYDPQENLPGHVFVVVHEPDGRSTWIDPVLSGFNTRYPAPINYTDNSPAMALYRVSGIGGYRIGDAGQDLAANLKAYELGLVQSVYQLQNNNVVDQGINEILQQAANSLVPGASAALQYLQQGEPEINKLLGGQGTFLSRVVDTFLSGNLLTDPFATISQLFKGRTFNTDSYLGASDYSYFVLGVDKGASTNVTDAEVPPALKWYITKLGIYVSGRQHIDALRKSVDDYMALYKVNQNTTMDRVRVQYAKQVLDQYMPYNYVKKYWLTTVGVYDNPVTRAIFAARIHDEQALADVTGSVSTGLTTGTDLIQQATSWAQSNPLLAGAVLVGGALLIYEATK